jgi:hypothetical protein
MFSGSPKRQKMETDVDDGIIITDVNVVKSTPLFYREHIQNVSRILTVFWTRILYSSAIKCMKSDNSTTMETFMLFRSYFNFLFCKSS